MRVATGASLPPQKTFFAFHILPHPLLSCCCCGGCRQRQTPLGWWCPDPASANLNSAPPRLFGVSLSGSGGASRGRMPRSTPVRVAAATVAGWRRRPLLG
uniref:Uncharacterized protein n=1 Tax=Setaria viridis TaxID=4556 RepID=A0A4U6TDB7_SETVI|nr:hypothetical protein SEVIR_8G086800v2 [Setaria viridis]